MGSVHKILNILKRLYIEYFSTQRTKMIKRKEITTNIDICVDEPIATPKVMSFISQEN
jgi:hypothetical protein